MSQDDRAIYWLGAHKTGTTFLQACLDASRGALEAHGFSYQKLEAFRQAHTRPLLDIPAAVAPVQNGLDGRRRLIFDENILGLVQHVSSPEGLYVKGPWRADEMADHLGLESPQLVLGLRSFSGFLPSLYCEALKSTPFRPFRTFLRTPEEKLSWQPLVTGLLDIFSHSEITIYAAERLRKHEIRLLSHLLDIPIAALTRVDHSERPGFSQRTVDEMMRLHAEGTVDRNEIKRLVKTYPRGSHTPGFDPWTQDERERLDALYAADLKAISAWPRVTLLDPATLPA